MNGLNKLKNNKKTVDKKNIVKVCESDDDDNNNDNDIVSVESDKKKCDDKCDGDKKDSDVKKKRNRPTKAQLYKEERMTILNKLNNILGIIEDNKIFYIYDIENNDNKQKEINDLFNDITKYFKGKSTALFAKDSIERKWLSIIKIVYKEMNFDMEHGIQNIKRDDKKIKSSFYKIVDPTTL